MSEVGDKVMRAKMVVQEVIRYSHSETIRMTAVSRDHGYPADGSDEDNTFAKFSPSGSFEVQCTNPDMFGKINPGERFYLDFTRAPDKDPKPET